MEITGYMTLKRGNHKRFIPSDSKRLYVTEAGELVLASPNGVEVPVISGSGGSGLNVMDYGAIGDGVADDTDAIQDVLDIAAASVSTRTVFFPPGIYKGNWTIPLRVRLQGCGDNGIWGNPGGPIFPGPVTVLRPANESLAVLRITQLDGQHVSDMHVEGLDKETSTHGLLVRGPSNNPAEFVGGLLQVRRCTFSDFQVGIEINNSASNLLEHVWSNKNRDFAYKFTNQSDTISMHKCGGSWNDGTIISTVAPKGLLVLAGEWGNGPGPVISTTGIGQISFISNNIETITSAPVIVTESTSINADLNRVDAPLSPAFIRQMDQIAEVSIRGGYLGVSPAGYLWEGPTAARAPHIEGNYANPLFLRWSPDNTFGSTIRTQSLRGVYARAVKSSTQSVATNTGTLVTFDTEVADDGGNMVGGVFTAPSAGVYSIHATFMIEDANGNTSRMVEMVNGLEYSILASITNHPAYTSIGGSCSRRLEAGDVYGVAFWQNSGGNIDVFGSGALNECSISITKISD